LDAEDEGCSRASYRGWRHGDRDPYRAGQTPVQLVDRPILVAIELLEMVVQVDSERDPERLHLHLDSTRLGAAFRAVTHRELAHDHFQELDRNQDGTIDQLNGRLAGSIWIAISMIASHDSWLCYILRSSASITVSRRRPIASKRLRVQSVGIVRPWDFGRPKSSRYIDSQKRSPMISEQTGHDERHASF